MTSSGPTRTTPPRTRWWRTPAFTYALGALYLVLGAWWVVDAVRGGRQGGYAFGPLLLLAGVVFLARGRPVLRDGVVQVPARGLGRRRIAVADIERFTLPHAFSVANRPGAVLRSGEQVPLRDVSESLVQEWSDATGVPVVRDPKPS